MLRGVASLPEGNTAATVRIGGGVGAAVSNLPPRKHYNESLPSVQKDKVAASLKVMSTCSLVCHKLACIAFHGIFTTTSCYNGHSAIVHITLTLLQYTIEYFIEQLPTVTQLCTVAKLMLC